MNVDYAEILQKLNQMNTNYERLRDFDASFHIIMQTYSAKDTLQPLVNEDGSIQIENIKKLTDKLGMGTLSFYSPSEDKCTAIPTKDTILLIALGIGIKTEEADRLLKAAGYCTYMKNLREFIIYCGLKYGMSIDEVREKLIQYGYRETAALENVEYRQDKSKVKKFSSRFKEICQSKGLAEKKVLEEAELVAPEFDADKNRYYYNACYGTKSVQIILEYNQVVKLFKAMQLTDEEMLDYAKLLSKLDVISESDKDKLSDWIQAGIKNEQESWHQLKIAQVLEKSVFTQKIAFGMENTNWDNIDEFITDHFGPIRSFAIFYQQVLDYEGFDSVAKFCKNFKLSDRSHYSYFDGSSIPELSHLTAVAFLMKKMTIQIYNTLLKKAGKLAYEEEEESAIYIIAKSLLLAKTEQVVMFGTLYDFIETLVLDQEQNLIKVKREELGRLYLDLSKIVSRNLLSYIKDIIMKEAYAAVVDEELNFIKSLTIENSKEMNINFSNLVSKIISQWDQQNINEFRTILKERLGFIEDSYLMTVINSSPEIGEEINYG